MLFNWDTTNLCLVFPQWRVTGTFSLLLSLLGVVLLCAGYELVRSLSRRYEVSSAEYLHQLPRMSPISTVLVVKSDAGKNRSSIGVSEAERLGASSG